jgi:hypothetical protein
MATIINWATGQSVYYDVSALSNLNPKMVLGKVRFNKQDTAKLAAILQKYEPNEKYYKGLVFAFSKNPFFNLPDNNSASTVVAKMLDGRETLWGVAGSPGGIDVTNLADGIARFMVERTKEELSIAFFRKFQDELKTKYPGLQKVFPETFLLLMNIDKDIYRFNIYLTSLREAFIHDLSNLYLRFPEILKDPQYKAWFNANPGLKAMLTGSLYVINGLATGKHPGEIFENYPAETLDALQVKDLLPAMQTMVLLSRSVHSADPDRYWVKPDSLKKLFADPELIRLRLYLGLIYQQAGGIKFSNGDSLRGVLQKLAGPVDAIGKYKNFITDLVNSTDEIQFCLDEYLNKRKSEIDYRNYYRYFNSLIDLVALVPELSDLPGMGFLSVKADRNFTRSVFVMRKLGDVYLDVNQQNYSAAIIHSRAIFDTLFFGMKNAETDAPVGQAFMDYGIFMAAIATAKSPDEVKNVLEATVMPVGSSSIKSYSSWHISVNSYVGVFGGHEWIPDVSDDLSFNTAGICAPIGIAVSTRMGKKIPAKGIGSISLFVTAIDLGALTSYRFGDSETSTIPEITLENIIAPGGYLILGRIANTPLSLGVGYQFGPQLRKVTRDAIETIENSSRVTAFLAVDIPFFNIYTRPAK